VRWREITPPLIGAAIGLLSFASGLGFDIVNPAQTAWVLVEGDHRIHFLGWHMFGHERWTMPPGVMVTYGFPIGTSIAYTDSIPIFAFLFKLVRPVIPWDFQYLGLWLLLAYVLQGFFAVLLLRARGLRPVVQILGSALFVVSPPLLFRYGHPALSAHWLLLACLCLYFTTNRLTMHASVTWIVLAVISAATHPYLALMVAVLAVAHHSHCTLESHGTAAARAAISLAVVGASILAMFWLTGYFAIGDSSNIQGAGLGLFSMNALALVMPREGSALFGNGPFGYATTGQYEGYAYFGAGALLLLVIVAVAAVLTGRLRSAFDVRHITHIPLVGACVLFVLMALSPRITAGESLLFAYDESWWGPLTLFRASGRMFWPVFYLLMLLVVVGTARLLRRRVAVVLVTIAVVLQAVDLSSVYTTLRHVRLRNWQNPLQSTAWSIVQNFRHLVLIPTNICSGAEGIDYTPFALLAGRSGVTINAGFAARYDQTKVTAYCRDASFRLQAGDVRDDEMYVLRPGLVGVLRSAASTPLVCLPADGYQICFTAEGYRRWQQNYDIVRQALIPGDEVVRLHARLETIYRDDLSRAAVASPLSAAAASESIIRYLSYRVAGCSHDEATSKLRDEIAGANPLRLCRRGYLATYDLPPPHETLSLRMDLERFTSPAGNPGTQLTHVDAEGQAVWVQEYARLRRGGQTESEATELLRAAIRRAAGSGAGLP
jgi:hypothetical protein